MPAALRLAACLLVAASHPALAEDRYLVEGLFDAELWKTDAGSRLLSLNKGEPAPEGRLRLWAAGDFAAGLQGFALAELEGGEATDETGVDTELEQAYLRFTFKRPRRLVLEAGRIPAPVGNFSRRYLSSVNPLVGSPSSYSVSYPLGLQITGRAARFDYRVAVVDLPLANANYVPEPGRALRPMLAAGVTPMIGLRIGGYATRGPYLDEDLPLAPGAAWKDYRQGVIGVDLAFSRGYFELNGDFNRSAYEVPGHSGMARGKAWFIEPKYTWSPRFFAALRLEGNLYPRILATGPPPWTVQIRTIHDAEAGVGCRLSQGATLKLSYRRDRWQVPDSLKAILPDGYSVSAQLSWRFDVKSWMKPPG